MRGGLDIMKAERERQAAEETIKLPEGMGVLTREEILLVETLAVCMNLFGKITGTDDTRSADLHEAAINIHNLQNMVLAQAAARAYPKDFRLLGGRIEGDD